jgi:hypothetical protein
MCTFSKIQLFTSVFLSFYLPCVKIINKILKMFCCLTLIYVVVCASRDGWLRTARSFTELQDRLRPHWIVWNPNHITSLQHGSCKTMTFSLFKDNDDVLFALWTCTLTPVIMEVASHFKWYWYYKNYTQLSIYIRGHNR